MSINVKRYVDITSGVGGAPTVARRQLVGRFITKSTFLGSDEIFEATSPEQVLAKFNNDVNSPEYRRAQSYFGFVNKNIKSPKMMSFVRWDTTTFRPPVLQGNSSPKSTETLEDIKAMGPSAGFDITYGAAAAVSVTYDAASAADFVDLAPIIQAAIRSAGAAQTALAQCTVTYNLSSNRFIITGASNGSSAGEIVVSAASADDTASLLGFLDGDVRSTAGRVGDNAVQTMSRHTNRSDNFGSFAFISALSDWQGDDVGNRSQDVAAWNAPMNNKFMFCHYVTQAQATAGWFAAHRGFGGMAVTLTQDNGASPSIDNEVFQAQSPMEILAATDYDSVNGTQNYMFYTFDNRSFAEVDGKLAPRPGTVGDDDTADYMDAYRINYQGITMQAGQQIAFYQRGLLMGGPTDAVDMNTYANEMWLKDAMLAQILGFFRAMPKVSANETDRGKMLLQIQDIIDAALFNGVISPGKPLTSTQKAYITTNTGDEKAWYQVQSSGYWIDAVLESKVSTITGLNEWQFKYVLVYSKDDVVRKVTGSDILI